ncbi:MAG: SCO7613 C-terminal domain-containing membrane protein [Acidimicrobiales bacterium]
MDGNSVSDPTPVVPTPAVACPACGSQDVGNQRLRCLRCSFPLDAPEGPRLQQNTARHHELVALQQRTSGELGWLGRQRGILLQAVWYREHLGEAPAASQAGVVAPSWPAAGWGAPPDVAAGVGGARVTAGFGPGRKEVGVQQIKHLFLWAGAALLGLSAFGFAGLEWSHVGPSGRAVMLAAAAVLVCSLSFAIRRRLPAAAEAVGALGQVLVVAEWALARHAGVAPGVALETWWAIGSVLSTFVGLALGAAGIKSGRVLGGVALVFALPLLAGTHGSAASPQARLDLRVPVLSVLAAIEVLITRVLWKRHAWRETARVVVIGAFVSGAASYLAAASLLIHGQVGHLTGGVLVASTALVPALAWVLFSADLPVVDAALADAAVFAAGASLVGGALEALSAAVTPRWLDTVVLGLVIVVLIASRLVFVRLGRGLRALSVVGACVGLAAATPSAVVTVFEPLRQWQDGWSGALAVTASSNFSSPAWLSHAGPSVPALCELAIAALWVAAGSASLPDFGWSGQSPRLRPLLRRAPAVIVAGSLIVLASMMAPLVWGADVAVVIVVELALTGTLTSGACLVSRWIGGESRWAAAPAVAIGVVGLSCLGWCAATPEATLVGLGALSLCALSLSIAAGRSVLGGAATGACAVLTLALTGVAASALHAGTSRSCLVVVIAAGVLLLACRQRPVAARVLPATTATTEAIAFAGMGVPALFAAHLGALSWLAIDLSVALVATAAAALLPARPGYRYVAAAVALPAVCSWIAQAHVHLVEAYTWPCAAILVRIGVLALRDSRATGRISSWLTFGPGIVLALGPSTALAVHDGGFARPVCVAALALVILLAGAKARLQAPIAIPLSALGILAVDAAYPTLAGGPRWIAVGVVGVLLLWTGATAERRLASFRRASSKFRALG